MLNFIKFILIEEEGISHHVTFARCNPPSRSHTALVDSVVNQAKQNKARHTIYLTRTVGKKDPLTPEQKIKHARRSFPKANIELTSSDAPTMLHQASKLHDQGINHLHVHVGSDRRDDFERLLNTYNGKEGKHGYYNFHSINVHSFGKERNNNSNGDESVSGTKMRAAVSSGNRDAFHKMASTNLNKTQKNELFDDVQSGMGLKDKEE